MSSELKTTIMKGKIPVSAAKKVAQEYGLKQCLLIGWDGELAHVVTYGKTKADCEAAAKAQDFWQEKIKEFSFNGETAQHPAVEALREYRRVTLGWLSPELHVTAEEGLNAIKLGDKALTSQTPAETKETP